MKVAVIGAGSWGSAVARLLAGAGYELALWARNDALACSINSTHENPTYLPDISLNSRIVAYSQLPDALRDAKAVVLAVPSQAVRQTCTQMAADYPDGIPLLLLSKGLENDSGMLLLEVVGESLAASTPLAVLSGPNHAEEVARQMLSATVIAATDLAVARFFQELFNTEYFRVYTSSDTVGVQLCGAAKNIVAIASGAAAGLKLGDNCVAMLMTRGLAEISRLVAACGGQSQTCMGLAGMGDLIVTCTSKHSRNRSFGLALATGANYPDYQRQRKMVVEGALACRPITELARGRQVEMPIAETIRKVIWENHPLQEIVPTLMQRATKPEFY